MLPRFVSTFLSRLSPAPEGCECASMKPGKTVPPAASITSVPADARFRTSASDPTATKRPFLIATADAVGKSGSWVRTDPFTRIRSGANEDGVVDVAHPEARPAAATVPSPRKFFRLISLMLISTNRVPLTTTATA